jgi:hypothetical protein
MNRLGDKINVSLIAIIAWMLLEIVSLKQVCSKIDERTAILMELFKPEIRNVKLTKK